MAAPCHWPRPAPMGLRRACGPPGARARPPPCRAPRFFRDHSIPSPTAISTSCAKPSLFAAEERRAMVEETCGALARASGCDFVCTTFADLVVAAAQREGATLLIRGLRSATDFDYEMEMAGMNATMAPAVQTVFLPAAPAVRPITATLVRQIASMGGDVSPFVPPPVAVRLKAKFAGTSG